MEISTHTEKFKADALHFKIVWLNKSNNVYFCNFFKDTQLLEFNNPSNKNHF